MKELANLSDRERSVAIKRADILDKYSKLRDSGYTAAKACKTLGVSGPTMSRWLKALNEFGIAGLADRKSARRAGICKMSVEQRNFLYQTTLKEEDPKLWIIYHQMYLQFCETLGQEHVSYSTFIREYQKIPANESAQYLKDYNINKA